LQEKKLNFHARVLGLLPTIQLTRGHVLQTIRSRKETAPFFSMRGFRVQIHLDDIFLYNAKITGIRSTNLGSLNQFDAECGGFESLDELQSALKRAGFRFQPLKEYEGFAIGFQKEKEDMDSQPLQAWPSLNKEGRKI